MAAPVSAEFTKPIYVTVRPPAGRDGVRPKPRLIAVAPHIVNGRVVLVDGSPVLSPKASRAGWELYAVHGRDKPKAPAERQSSGINAGLTDELAATRQQMAEMQKQLDAALKRAAEAEELVNMSSSADEFDGDDEDGDDEDE